MQVCCGGDTTGGRCRFDLRGGGCEGHVLWWQVTQLEVLEGWVGEGHIARYHPTLGQTAVHLEKQELLLLLLVLKVLEVLVLEVLLLVLLVLDVLLLL